MKKINKVIQITAFFSSLGASIISFIQGHNSEGIAWGCCIVWVAYALITEYALVSAEQRIKELEDLIKN